MWTFPIIQKILNTFPTSPGRIWCAGSAAIIPHKANDVDVFVLMKGLNLPPKSNMCGGNDVPAPTYPADNIKIQRIINYPYGLWKQPSHYGFVQVIYVDHDCIHSVLNTFDCSCHAWAIDQSGKRIMHPKATLPGEPIQFICPDNKSEGRKAEFTQRYAKEASKFGYDFLGGLKPQIKVTYHDPANAPQAKVIQDLVDTGVWGPFADSWSDSYNDDIPF